MIPTTTGGVSVYSENQWARLWPAAGPRPGSGVRHGAWYPIREVPLPDRLVIEVLGRRVTVPRRLFEVETRSPNRFTVVVLPRDADSEDSVAVAGPPIGHRYAVCPAEGCRVPLFGQPERLQCPHCGFEGEVAWWETG